MQVSSTKQGHHRLRTSRQHPCMIKSHAESFVPQALYVPMSNRRLNDMPKISMEWIYPSIVNSRVIQLNMQYNL